MAKEVYWHLPGFFIHFYINQVMLDMMTEFPEKFNDGYTGGSVYGTFPGAVWNGGRAVFGKVDTTIMKTVIHTYNNLGVSVRFTWTNSYIGEDLIHDEYCNTIMDIANNGMNQVLCNSRILEDYLRDKYPDFDYISSTTKRLTNPDDFEKELESGRFFMAVLDYDLNHDEETLKRLEKYADKVEILADEICFPNCPKRLAHYNAESKAQISQDKNYKPFDCPNTHMKPEFELCKKRPAFISNEEIGSYIDRGFVNYKLVGRGLPQKLVIDSYLYYLVKPEERMFIRNRLIEILDKLMK